MNVRRWAIFGFGVVASLALTLAFGGVFLFLLFPLVWGAPFRFNQAGRACPSCGHTTTHPAERYCPKDGARLR